MTTKKKWICFALALLTITISVIGCNTVEGAGRDIERAGEEIQDAAR